MPDEDTFVLKYFVQYFYLIIYPLFVSIYTDDQYW